MSKEAVRGVEFGAFLFSWNLVAGFPNCLAFVPTTGGGVLLWGGSSQTVFACDRYFGSRLGQKAQGRVVVGYAPPKPEQTGVVKSVEREKGLVGTTNFQSTPADLLWTQSEVRVLDLGFDLGTTTSLQSGGCSGKK